MPAFVIESGHIPCRVAAALSHGSKVKLGRGLVFVDGVVEDGIVAGSGTGVLEVLGIFQ